MVSGREIRATLSGTKEDLHRPTTFAIQDTGSIHYPDPDAPPPRLF
jgi:hypothetical protein